MSEIVAIGSTIDEFDLVVLEEGWLHGFEEIDMRLKVPALYIDLFFIFFAVFQATFVISRPGLAI